MNAQGTFRADIQGMRGVAVLLVVVHHAWPGVLPAGFIGVDVFFTVSGFVIGSLLLAELDRSGTIDLAGFWIRRARRILPASLLVVVATLGAAWFWAPATQRDEIGHDGLWASLFAANFRFIQQGTDYAAAERDPSPFQHFWSLAVEEQFYLVVPLIFVLAAVAARRRTWPARRVLGIVMTLVCVASLACSVMLTSENPTVAYFSPFTRAWQLGAGVLAACAVPLLTRRPGRWPDALGLAGIAGLAVAVATLDSSGAASIGYPSFLSAAPTCATVAMLLAGTGHPGPGARALSLAPLRRVGDVSYSFYLWHWPVLVAATWVASPGPVVNGLLVVLAYSLAELSYRWVENPIRRSSWLASRRSVTAATALASIWAVSASAAKVGTYDARVAVDVAGVPSSPSPEPTSAEPDDRNEFDLRASELPDPAAKVTVDAGSVYADYPTVGERGCQRDYLDDTSLPDVHACTLGRAAHGDPEHRLVYLIGDSMATAISPAVGRAAKRHGAALRVLARASCTLSTGVTVHKNEVGGSYRDCDRFRDNLLDHVERARPAAVFMVNSNGSNEEQVDEDDRRTPESSWLRTATGGLVRSVDRLRSAGIPVVLIENPAKPGGQGGTACLADGGDVDECSFKDKPHAGVYERAFEQLDREVPLVRVNTHVCPRGRCSPVLGDLVVWRDDSHFTRSYARTLAPAFERALGAALRAEGRPQGFAGS